MKSDRLIALAGAMSELKRRPQETGFIDTWIFNSSKAFLIAPPANGRYQSET